MYCMAWYIFIEELSKPICHLLLLPFEDASFNMGASLNVWGGQLGVGSS